MQNSEQTASDMRLQRQVGLAERMSQLIDGHWVGWGQISEASRALGVGRDSLKKMMANQVRIPAMALVRLVEVTSCRAEWLLFGRGEPSDGPVDGAAPASEGGAEAGMVAEDDGVYDPRAALIADALMMLVSDGVIAADGGDARAKDVRQALEDLQAALGQTHGEPDPEPEPVATPGEGEPVATPGEGGLVIQIHPGAGAQLTPEVRKTIQRMAERWDGVSNVRVEVSGDDVAGDVVDITLLEGTGEAERPGLAKLRPRRDAHAAASSHGPLPKAQG
jgi:hypothetical protein